MFRLAYVVTHPIQYQAPLLRYLAQTREIDLEVFFLSDFSLQDHYERAFNQTLKWDVPLSEGYRWQVLPSIFALNSGRLRPWVPLRSLRRYLCNGGFDAVWVHGWGHIGLLQAVHEAYSCGLPVLMRGDSTSVLNGMPFRSRIRRKIYRWLFPRVAGFLCIGSLNRAFYQQYGVPECRLFSAPYAVDNAFFQKHCAEAALRREDLRSSLGLQRGRPIALFAARITSIKAPDELLSAFATIYERFDRSMKPYLLFVGDGPLRARLEERSRALRDAVRFLGFRNQTELPAFYDLCDVFVLPSRFEPWGLVVNEVMNAGRPVIVSDRVGAAPDLVTSGKNGFIYPSGDCVSLGARLAEILLSPELRSRMGESSLKRISMWDFEADRVGLLQALAAVCQR